MHDWVHGTPAGDWTSAGHRLGRLVRRARGAHLVVPGDVASAASWEIVQGLDVDEFSRGRIDASVAELVEERDAVQALGLL